MVVINGKETEGIAGITLAEYISGTDYELRRIAAELNGEIVPKAEYGTVILKDGDNVEIVSFVGGG